MYLFTEQKLEAMREKKKIHKILIFMISKIKIFLGGNNKPKPKTDFSVFFHNTSSSEKKKLLEKVIREASKDQRDLMNRKTRKT